MMQAQKAQEAKRKQKHDNGRAFEPPNQSKANLKGNTQYKALPESIARVQLAQDLWNAPDSHERTSADEFESTREWGSNYSAVGEEGDLEGIRVEVSQEHEEGLNDCSTTASLDEMIEEESLRLKDFGYMSDEDFDTKSTSNCLSAFHPNPTAQATPELATSAGGQGNSARADKSTEQGAARTWPKCKQTCGICRTTHVAIPGSSLSQTCVRISMSICDAPAPVTENMPHESILVPTDTYELSVLGWLIWSTFANQVTLRNARVGWLRKAKSQRPRDYIRTEISRFHRAVPFVVHTKHLTKATFQQWWEGKRNISYSSGKRWMVITFPWDMGDIDIFEAKFGTMGSLFSFPTLVPPQGTGAEAPTGDGAKLLPESQTGCPEVAEDSGDNNISDRDGDIGGKDEKVDENAVEVKEGKDDIHELIDSFSEGFKWLSSRSNPAFHTTWRTSRRPVMTATERTTTPRDGKGSEQTQGEVTFAVETTALADAPIGRNIKGLGGLSCLFA